MEATSRPTASRFWRCKFWLPPGFRQLHVRRAGQEEVYAVRLNSFDFPTEHSGWLDKSLLQPQGDIIGLEGPDFNVEKQAEFWQLVEGEGEVVEQEVKKLASALATLLVQNAEENTTADSNYELMVTAAGTTHRYRFFQQGNNYYISRDDYTPVFRISRSDFEEITGQTATQLVKKNVTEDGQRDS